MITLWINKNFGGVDRKMYEWLEENVDTFRIGSGYIEFHNDIDCFTFKMRWL